MAPPSASRNRRTGVILAAIFAAMFLGSVLFIAFSA
jgi:hypothetical protein